MEKRAFIAVGLSIAVFYIFSMMFAPEKKPLDNVAKPVANSVLDSAKAVPAPAQVAQIQPSASDQSLPTNVLQKNVTVDTDLYTAVFSSKGGSLKSMTLKKYREQNSPTAKPVTLGNDADPNVLSFSTRAAGIALTDNTVYTTDIDSVVLNGKESKQLIFNYVSGQGYTVRKIYTLTAGTYGIKLETQVFNNSAAPITGSIQHVMTYPAEPKVKDNRFDTAGAYLLSDGSIQSNKIKDVATSSKRYEKSVSWSGFADKYFLNAILADKNSRSLLLPSS